MHRDELSVKTTILYRTDEIENERLVLLLCFITSEYVSGFYLKMRQGWGYLFFSFVVFIFQHLLPMLSITHNLVLTKKIGFILNYKA